MKNHLLNNRPPADHFSQADTPKGEHAIIETYVLKEIHDEIERLPSPGRELFKLIFFHEINTAEAARKLNIPYKTALKHQEQALSLLRFTVLKQCLSYLPEATPVE